MMTTETVADSILFTPSAADKVASLLADEKNDKLHLRVSVVGGGCSGFQYQFSFDEQSEEDWVIEQFTSEHKSVKLLIDALSYDYLKGAEVDYTQGIQGEQFVIRNPNAETTCGCGSSFSISDE